MMALPICEIALTFTPPEGWTDREYDAALGALKDAGMREHLFRHAMALSRNMPALDGVVVALGPLDPTNAGGPRVSGTVGRRKPA